MWREAALCIVGLAAGVILALAVLPTLAGAIPHDYARLKLLLAAADQPPAVAVFGDSVAMSSVDARLLSVDARNFGSVAQTPGESLLLRSRLPASTRVVQFVAVKHLERAGGVVNIGAYDLMVGFGLKPEPALLAELGIDRSPLRSRFDSRWVIRQLVDAPARQRVRPDLRLERARADLYYPSVYTQRVASHVVEERLETIRQLSREPGYAPKPNKVRLLRSLAAGNTLLVLQPIHPRLRDYYGADYCELATQHLRSLGAVDPLDLCFVLDDDEFIDHVHPTHEGARRLTALIDQALLSGER